MEAARKSVCVTRAGGFIAKGHYNVCGTVRNPDDSKNAHLKALQGAGERLQLFKAMLDYNNVASAIAGCEGVFHVASPVQSSKFSNHETSFCSICHLTSGEKEGDELRRNSDVLEILRKTMFPRVRGASDVKSPEAILEHDRNIIWLGGLNYQIAYHIVQQKFLWKCTTSSNYWRRIRWSLPVPAAKNPRPSSSATSPCLHHVPVWPSLHSSLRCSGSVAQLKYLLARGSPVLHLDLAISINLLSGSAAQNELEGRYLVHTTEPANPTTTSAPPLASAMPATPNGHVSQGFPRLGPNWSSKHELLRPRERQGRSSTLCQIGYARWSSQLEQLPLLSLSRRRSGASAAGEGSAPASAPAQIRLEIHQHSAPEQCCG